MRLSLLALLFGSVLSAFAAEPEILASGELAADAVDAKGDTIGGIGSGIVYDAERDVYLMISDRGPGDGSLPYRPRVVVLKIRQEGMT